MKNLLLLGDSIRMGYQSFVQEKLANRMNVYFPGENGRFAQYTLRSLHDWKEALSLPEIHVIHWNNGLWDSMHLNAGIAECPPELAGETISPANVPGKMRFDKDPLTPPEMYRYMLIRVLNRIHQLFPKAEIIFATTTPVIEAMAAIAYRTNEEIEKYNCIARETLIPLGVRINELGKFAMSHCSNLHPEADWVHYTPQGYNLLAEEIVSFLDKENLIF